MFSIKGQGGVVLAVGFAIIFGLLFWAFLQVWFPIQDDLLIPTLEANASASNTNIVELMFFGMPFFLAVLGIVAIFIIASSNPGRPTAEF